MRTQQGASTSTVNMKQQSKWMNAANYCLQELWPCSETGDIEPIDMTGIALAGDQAHRPPSRG